MTTSGTQETLSALDSRSSIMWASSHFTASTLRRCTPALSPSQLPPSFEAAPSIRKTGTCVATELVCVVAVVVSDTLRRTDDDVFLNTCGGDLEVTVIHGACNVTLSAGSHSGDMLFFTSALRGCRRSGERARRYSGDLLSLVLGRPKLFFGVELMTVTFGGDEDGDSDVEATLAGDNATTVAGEVFVDGLYDCVVFELPGWWPVGNMSGLGERVGEEGNGEGDGVRASGDKGMWPIDLRRLGDCTVARYFRP